MAQETVYELVKRMRKEHRLSHFIGPDVYRMLEELAADGYLTEADTLIRAISLLYTLDAAVFSQPGRRLATLDENGQVVEEFKNPRVTD
jgi:hypothetical protein